MRFFDKFSIKEILKFCVGGGSAVIVDFCMYYILKKSVDVFFAKSCSFILGAMVGFLINKFWTFNSLSLHGKEIIKYVILYVCSASVNVIVNKCVLNVSGLAVLAFFVATACSTMINFLGQKFFVFSK